MVNHDGAMMTVEKMVDLMMAKKVVTNDGEKSGY